MNSVPIATFLRLNVGFGQFCWSRAIFDDYQFLLMITCGKMYHGSHERASFYIFLLVVNDMKSL